jgi:hypothetical protein
LSIGPGGLPIWLCFCNPAEGTGAHAGRQCRATNCLARVTRRPSASRLTKASLHRAGICFSARAWLLAWSSLARCSPSTWSGQHTSGERQLLPFSRQLFPMAAHRCKVGSRPPHLPQSVHAAAAAVTPTTSKLPLRCSSCCSLAGAAPRRAIVPIGLCYAGTLWVGNAAYLYLSVSFIQMLKVRL